MPKKSRLPQKQSPKPMPPEIVDEITTPRGEGYSEVPGFTLRKNELYELMKHRR
jgi:hypothetical protein